MPVHLPAAKHTLSVVLHQATMPSIRPLFFALLAFARLAIRGKAAADIDSSVCAPCSGNVGAHPLQDDDFRVGLCRFGLHIQQKGFDARCRRMWYEGDVLKTVEQSRAMPCLDTELALQHPE